MDLAFLSGDILAQIARYSGTSAILALWKCGNTALNKKLSEWIDEIDLEDQNPASTSRYPKFLSSLSKLRVLRLVRFGHLAPTTTVSQELQRLSSTLTELTLSAVRCFDPFLALPDSQLKLDEPQPSSTTTPILSYWNIALTFPHLIKLVVKRNFYSLDATFIVPRPILSILPSSMEHLEFEDGILSSGELICHYLSLHTVRMSAFDKDSLVWPPNLTRLDGRARTGPFGADSFFAGLPRALKSMPWMTLTPSIEAFKQAVTPLPSSLEELRLPSVRLNGCDMSWLPSTITKLDCRTALGAMDLLNLPHQLTHLNVININLDSLNEYLEANEDVNCESFWPRKLRFLSVDALLYNGDARPLSQPIFAALPTSLTELHFKKCDPSWEVLGLGDLSRYPSLKAFSITLVLPIFRASVDFLREDAQDASLPGSLFESLRSSSLTALSLQFASGTLGIIVMRLEELFGWLPHSLTSLKLDFSNTELISTPEAWFLLPTSLTDLALTMAGFSSVSPKLSTILPFLPPKLKFLKLRLSGLPTEADLLSMPCYGSLLIFDFSHLGMFTTTVSRESQKLIASCFPDSALFQAMLPAMLLDQSPALDLVNGLRQRDQQYPDPRVLQP